MKILGFGDSLTAGTPGYMPGYGGDARSQYGFWLLESARNDGITSLQFHNQGIPGELAIMMPQRLRNLLEVNHYDLVITMAGTNDLGWDIEPSDVYDSLFRLWEVSTSREITTIACSIPPIGMIVPHHQQMQQELNQRILQEGRHLPHLLVADVFSKLADDKSILHARYDSGDGLHLSVEGYRRIGEFLWGDVVRTLV
jgi:lysophospholipase L1-like esterase